jgi:chromosome segregation ATPase
MEARDRRGTNEVSRFTGIHGGHPMADRKEQYQELMAKLEQQRDELRLKMHLAKAEAKEEWEELEKKWDRLKSRMGDAGDEADDAWDDIQAAAGILADEIKKGYDRIRKAF